MKKRVGLTPAELYLWKLLRNHPDMPGWKFQYRTRFYRMDFYHPVARVCIEADGYHHWKQERMGYDRNRTARLRRDLHCEVLRFTNTQIFERTEPVMAEILAAYREGVSHVGEPDIEWYRRIGTSIR